MQIARRDQLIIPYQLTIMRSPHSPRFFI